jgi:hypothetical protein
MKAILSALLLTTAAFAFQDNYQLWWDDGTYDASTPANRDLAQWWDVPDTAPFMAASVGVYYDQSVGSATVTFKLYNNTTVTNPNDLQGLTPNATWDDTITSPITGWRASYIPEPMVLTSNVWLVIEVNSGRMAVDRTTPQGYSWWFTGGAWKQPTGTSACNFMVRFNGETTSLSRTTWGEIKTLW